MILYTQVNTCTARTLDVREQDIDDEGSSVVVCSPNLSVHKLDYLVNGGLEKAGKDSPVDISRETPKILCGGAMGSWYLLR